jgi:hypothetical protein
MKEFVREAREEIRKLGFEERTHFIKIRPEEMGGVVLINR